MNFVRLLALTLAVFSAVLLNGEALAQRGGGSVVLLDRQKVIVESAAYKSVDSQIKALADQVNASLNQQEAALKKDAEALQASRDSLSKDDFGKRLQALAQKELDFVTAQQVAQNELQLAQANALKQLESPLVEAVESIAKKRKAGVVIERTMVIYAGSSPDITDDVLAQINKTMPTIQVVKPTTPEDQRAAIRQQIEQQIALKQYEAAGRQQLLALGQQSIAAGGQQ